MNNQLLWFLGLAVIALTQALVVVLNLKLKKGNPGNYGERIASLETDVENIKDDIKEIKRKLSRK